MKKLSVRMKITLWYAGIILMITVGLMGLLAFFAKKITWSKAEGNLKKGLQEFFEEVEWTDTGYGFDNDLEFYEDGISFSIYNTKGELVGGNVPLDFPENTTLKSGKGQTISSGEKKWLVYDEAYRMTGEELLWGRAIASAGNLSMIGQVLFTLVFVFVPVLGVIAIAGGYHITGKMLKPIEEALKRETTFTADVSHELRTPVAVMMSECEYALLEDASREEMQESLSIILKQCKGMSDLISQLLALARGEAGISKMEMKPIDISMLAQAVVEEMKGRAEEKRIGIEMSIQPDLIIQGDETSLMRMFVNLLDNAVKYGKEEGHIKVSLYQKGNYVTGEVADDGMGIPKEEQEHIWERFYQSDAARTKVDASGFGLGLPMVQWIIRAHQGNITVHSIPGEGTTFVFSLPQKI